MDIRRFLSDLKAEPEYRDQIVHTRYLPPREPAFGELDRPLPEALIELLRKNKIEKLYSHQAEAAARIRAGEDVVIASGTASGKTLCYNLPILEHLLSHPRDKAFYIFPTKALAHDQLRSLSVLTAGAPSLPVAVNAYDGDTPKHRRKKIRDSSSIIITNPDMLHAAILPHHTKWSRVLERLAFVVVDEIHTYRGVFGSHVALVLRRLERLVSFYGGRIHYICASATIGNPRQLAERLLNREMTLVAEDGSPKGEKYFVFWNPPVAGQREKTAPSPPPEGAPRVSAVSQAQTLLIKLMRAGAQTIAFTRSRAATELLYKYVHDHFAAFKNPLADEIKPYRGGYLAENRRQIESELFSGRLKAVTSTNALELGIDVGSLDACVLAGYPGSIAATWQRAGRAGRTRRGSIIFFIATNEPIDQFFMHRPEFFFEQSPEEGVINVDNPYILSAHLSCAAFELPLSPPDERYFGHLFQSLAGILEETGYVKRIGDRWHWSRSGVPSFERGLRTTTGDTYAILDAGNEYKVIGDIDAQSAFSMIYPGAIYLHEGESYYVRTLDHARKTALVEPSRQEYYTRPHISSELTLLKMHAEKSITGGVLGFGEVEVSTTVFAYSRMRYYSYDRLGTEKLDLPRQSMATAAFWLEILLDAEYLEREKIKPAEGLAGIKNLFLVVIPILSMCDRNDIGGAVDTRVFSTPSIFIYDRYPGGMGFAEAGFSDFGKVAAMAKDLMEGCACESGCPACVGAADPAQAIFRDIDEQGGWIPPDKKSALKLLSLLKIPEYSDE